MEKEEFDLSKLIVNGKLCDYISVLNIAEFIKIVEEIIKDKVSIPEKLRRLHKSAGDDLI